METSFRSHRKNEFFWDTDVRITASQSSLRLQILDGDWIISHF